MFGDPQLFLEGLLATMRGPVGLAFSLTLLGALTIGTLKQRKQCIKDAESDPPIGPNVPREQKIPVVQHDPDQVDRAAVMNRVSHLAVEGDWQILAREIADWESRLESAPGGERYHEIGVDTCLMGLQSLLDDAPRRSLDDLKAAEREIDRFMERHNAEPSDHILAVLAARAHLVMAETCNADYWPGVVQKAAWRQMAHHFLQAEAILNKFDPVAYMSPLLAGAAYDLAQGMPDGGARIEPAFDDWIDLDPSNPKIYAAHIPNLMQKSGENLQLLLEEAEQAVDRTEETLGQGGYALCVLPAIEASDDLREQTEADKLAGALMDLARSSATQAEVNWAASILAREADLGCDERKAILLSAFDALVQRDLTVIYPRIWDQDLDDIRAMLRATFKRNGGARVTSATLYAPRAAQAAA